MKLSAITSSGKSFVQLAIEHLPKLPNDEVYTIDELAEAIGRKPPTSSYHSKGLHKHGMLVMINERTRWVFGNPKALTKLRKRLANETTKGSGFGGCSR